MTKATKGIEVGTFTGYSALCMASRLPQNGKLICLGKKKDWFDIGRPFLEKAGVMEKIEPHTPVGQRPDELTKDKVNRMVWACGLPSRCRVALPATATFLPV